MPTQILKFSADNKSAEILEDYTAKELDVEEGEEVNVIQHLNGWVYAKHSTTGQEGWIPD